MTQPFIGHFGWPEKSEKMTSKSLDTDTGLGDKEGAMQEGEPMGSPSDCLKPGASSSAPHPSEWMVTVEVRERGKLIKKTVTFVHRGCELAGTIDDQGTQEELPW